MFGGTAECKIKKKGQSATQGAKVQLEGTKNAYVSTYNKTKTDTR